MTPLLAETATPMLLGLRADGTPIWHLAGADGWNNFAEPDEGDEGAEPDDGEEGEEEEAPEYTPPSEDEWRRTQDAIKRNNGENKRLRLLKKAAAAKGIDLSTDEGVQALQDMLAGGANASNKGTSDRGAVERAVEKATAKTESKYLPVVAGLAVKAALLDAGFSGNNRERIMKLIDLDDIDVVDGEVTGIAEQIAEIKTEFPEWFRGQKSGGERRRGASDVDGGDRRTKQTASSGGWLEKVDRQMTGG